MLSYNLGSMIVFGVVNVFFGILYYFVKSKTPRKLIMIMQITAFALFIGLREDYVGVDTTEYIRRFYKGYNIKNFIELGNSDYEYLFYFVILIFHAIGLNHNAFFLLVAVLYAYYAFKAFDLGIGEDYKSYIGIVFAIFAGTSTALLGGVNIIRQGLAMTIAMYSLQLYIAEENKKGFWHMIFAILIHKSSIIFIAPVIMLKQPFAMFKKNINVLVISLLLGMSPIMQIITSTVGGILVRHNTIDPSSLFPVKIGLLVCIVLACTFITKISTVDMLFEKNLYAFTILVSICLVLLRLPFISSRFLIYANIFIPYLLVKLVGSIDGKWLFILSVVMLNILYYLSIINYSAIKINFAY